MANDAEEKAAKEAAAKAKAAEDKAVREAAKAAELEAEAAAKAASNKVRITHGHYNTGTHVFGRGDEVAVDDKEASRLILLGVAERA